MHDANGNSFVMHIFQVPDKPEEKRKLLQAIKNKYDIMKKLTRDGNLNVPKVHDYQEDRKFVDQMGNQSLVTYILMDHIDGVSLAHIVDKRTPTGDYRIQRITEPFLRTLMKRVSLVLTKLHRSGVSHCDLKPDNILIDMTGQV